MLSTNLGVLFKVLPVLCEIGLELIMINCLASYTSSQHNWFLWVLLWVVMGVSFRCKAPYFHPLFWYMHTWYLWYPIGIQLPWLELLELPPHTTTTTMHEDMHAMHVCMHVHEGHWTKAKLQFCSGGDGVRVHSLRWVVKLGNSKLTQAKVGATYGLLFWL